MAITWTQGSTHVQLPFTFVKNDGSVLDLTSNTGISIAIQPISPLPTNYMTLSGTATVMGTPTNGQFQYKFATTDVAIAGSYNLVVTIQFSDGPVSSIPTTFTILPT